MQAGWPARFEKKWSLKISKIGRRTGRKLDVTIWFATDNEGRLFIATADTGRDRVKNVMRNPSVEVAIGGTTRRMKVLPLRTDSDKQYVNDLYAKKYLSAKLGRLLKPKGFARYGAFELQPE
jgi:selenophosphate synthetase-related protein